jgi:hypothetical protein
MTVGGSAAVILAVQRAAALDRLGAPHLPRPVGEHHHVGAELRAESIEVLARRHGIDAAVERMLRPRPDLDARLLVVLAVALHEAGPQRVDDHGAASSKRPRDSSMFLRKAANSRRRQAAAHAEAQLAAAQHVEHGGVLGDPAADRARQDHRGGADIHVRMARRQVGHQLKVVGTNE